MIISKRLQALAATSILAGGLGVAAVSGVFAATTPTPTGTATAAVSAAATTTGSTTPVATATSKPAGGPRGFFPGPFFGGSSANSIATFLGMSASDLQTALKNGQTLAQIAQAHGKTSADLKTFLLNQDSQRIDQLLTTNFQQAFANHPGPGPGGPRGGPGFGGPGLSGVATFLGISQSDLQTALKGGQTLAQVAQAHGKSASDLQTYLVNQLKTRLDAAVTAGRLTSQQETTQLTQATTPIQQMINTAGNQFGPGPGGPRGPRPAGSATPTATATTG